ncbi:hypothetical protein [Streptomyces sp. NPDC021356]|uniref:hypothetical protein n=1 Tax=Streptomyces sp. NPDC021356 TaxID=3154900 RepID=UPI003404551E
MPRGRHRHSPPLHRLLPPSAIAGVSLVCALGPWVSTAPVVLRSLAAAAAVTAVAGAVVLRRWDTQAGRKVADLTRARASDEWRFEERVAELESDLEESRELRVRLDQKLRAKRSELARLRNEHASLLRRYATAETERASALEGRRLLELEAAAELPALPAAPGGALTPARTEPAGRRPVATGSVAAGAAASGSVAAGSVDGAPVKAGATETGSTRTGSAEADSVEAGSADEEPAVVAPPVFSPAGSELFGRAMAALARFGADGDRPVDAVGAVDAVAKEPTVEEAPEAGSSGGAAGPAEPAPAREDDPEGKPEAADAHEHPAAAHPTAGPDRSAEPESAEPAMTEVAESAEAAVVVPGGPVRQPTGHYAVPTAVAVVPPAPARRPVTGGGFDFFGTQKGAPPAALEAVQNEDLADVVGQEALALHEAEAEAAAGSGDGGPADADAGARAVGQVIDLTAHDETEQIDLQGLRTAAS